MTLAFVVKTLPSCTHLFHMGSQCDVMIKGLDQKWRNSGSGLSSAMETCWLGWSLCFNPTQPTSPGGCCGITRGQSAMYATVNNKKNKSNKQGSKQADHTYHNPWTASILLTLWDLSSSLTGLFQIYRLWTDLKGKQERNYLYWMTLSVTF